MLAEKLQMLQDYVGFIHGKMSSDITLVEFLKIAFGGEKQLASFIAKTKLNSDAKSAAEILEKFFWRVVAQGHAAPKTAGAA